MVDGALSADCLGTGHPNVRVIGQFPMSPIVYKTRPNPLAKVGVMPFTVQPFDSHHLLHSIFYYNKSNCTFIALCCNTEDGAPEPVPLLVEVASAYPI
jgi:hypothetical protein